ncbi:amine oxidase, partial [Melampsora larici-populina 98AG31]
MPKERNCWTAWNYLIHDSGEAYEKGSLEDTVCLTYWMNRLQPDTLPESVHGPVFVSLNPPDNAIFPKDIIGRWTYHHPVYSAESVAAQDKISEIQTKGRMSFVGAWTGYGFHEDGFRSALRLMTVGAGEKVFGVKCPLGMDPRLPSTESSRTPLAVRVSIGVVNWFVKRIFGKENNQVPNRAKA